MPSRAQTASPGGKAVFVPGLYETESRNFAFGTTGERKRECLMSADAASFRRETMTRFLGAPQFRAVCRLSDARDTIDGFDFAMDCNGAKTIVTYQLVKDLVASVTDTKVLARPDYSSKILTLSHRIGACPKRSGPRG